MKYTLIAEDDFGGSTTTREFNADSLPAVLTEFELFLRGAGFYFDGNLDFVDDFGDPAQDDIFEDEWTAVRREVAIAEGAEFHSKYYFDTERNK